MAPVAVKAAKAREYLTVPMSRGALQHPIKNPLKCADSKRLICSVVKASSNPEKGIEWSKTTVTQLKKNN